MQHSNGTRLIKLLCWNLIGTKMGERIRAAKSAIAERQHEFSLDHDGTPEERQAISDALKSLRVLQMDAASWLERQNLGGIRPPNQASRSSQDA